MNYQLKISPLKKKKKKNIYIYIYIYKNKIKMKQLKIHKTTTESKLFLKTKLKKPCIPDNLFLVTVAALFCADLLSQACDFGIDTSGTLIHLLSHRTDLFGFGFTILQSKSFTNNEQVQYFTILLFGWKQYAHDLLIRNLIHYMIWYEKRKAVITCACSSLSDRSSFMAWTEAWWSSSFFSKIFRVWSSLLHTASALTCSSYSRQIHLSISTIHVCVYIIWMFFY